MNAFVIWVFATAWINVTALKTIVVTYEDSSCSSPATSVKLTSLLTCSPQANHFEPICESGGTAFSVSDCINYRRGGWDDLGILSDVLSKSTYLTVETYVAGRCGQWDSVSNVAIYRLDENCYPNAAGTESHQLTLGHSVTITKYSDATCSNVATTTTVQEAVLGASHVGVCVDDMTGFITGTMPDLNFVANYDDDTCSNTPNRLTFTQDFACKFTTDSPCQSNGVSRFTVAGCAKDFSAKAAEVFGANSPYVIVADYPNQWCNDVEYVTVYSADGLCHANEDDGTSFKAFITAEGTATILLYSDKACMDMVSNTNVDANTLSSSLCMYRSCNFWFGCGTRYSVGGLGAPLSMGKKTALVTYDDSSCSSPATSVKLTSLLTCSPQANHFEPICESGGTAFSVSDCINYRRGGWDDLGILSDVLSKSTYLTVETYVAGRCGQWDSVSNVAIYRLDENCYPNAAGTESHQLTLGHSVTITKYSDATCSNVATTTTVQEAVLGASHVGVCVDDMTGFITGTMPDLNFVANYDDDTCSNTPNRLTFTQDFACKFTTDSPCQSNGVSRFTVAGCAKDFSAKAAEVFGANSPYVIVADYPNQWCNDVEYVTVYSADGLCHANEDDGTSFKAFITAEGTATILLYSDKACMDMVSNTNVDTNTLSSSLCMYRSCNFWFGCGTRYSVGGLGAPISMGKKTAVVTYEDSSCLLTPIQVDVTDDGTSELGCTMTSAPQCTTMVGEGSTLYQSRECINDTEAFAESKYWKIPFLVVENYVNDTNCQVRKSISMYAADGKCHFRMSDGKYYTITQFMGDVTIRTYPTSSCKEIESSAFTIDLWQVNTGWCVKGQKFYTSKESIAKPQVPDPLTPSTSAPQTWTPSPTTSAPQTWTPSPTSAPQTCTCAPSPTTPAPDIVTVKDDIDARLSIMFPAWLWDPSPPRVFMSDGRHQKHHHQRYP